MKRQPEILHLSDPKHSRRAAKAMISGHPIVTDYGATFGTAFTPTTREKVAKLRQETPPLATVSLVATYTQTLAWTDSSHLHPHLHNQIQAHALRFFESIAFLRLPASDQARSQLGSNYVNPQGEFQSFIVPDTDPLLAALIALGHPPYYAVRSSNVTGFPEEFTVEGALTYAAQISAPILAVVNKDKPTSQHLRKRVRSQPILHFPQNSTLAEVVLTRMGNTHPEVFQVIANHLFPAASFKVQEEKSVDYRTQYHPKTDGIALEAIAIRQALLAASGLA